jgi:hypothetical protein
MLFYSDVPLSCINDAAYEYHVPAKLIIAVLNVEQGKVGMANRNSNGTYDLGPMQINTIWWPKLSRYGITQDDVKNSPCVNIKVGAWILSKSIVAGESLRVGVGNYHSFHTKLNKSYTLQVLQRYTKLSESLSQTD